MGYGINRQEPTAYDPIDGLATPVYIPGPRGEQGLTGKSAYQTALDAGFVGTEAQWLATLKGDTGEQGQPGTSVQMHVGTSPPENPETHPFWYNPDADDPATTSDVFLGYEEDGITPTGLTYKLVVINGVPSVVEL